MGATLESVVYSGVEENILKASGLKKNQYEVMQISHWKYLKEKTGEQHLPSTERKPGTINPEFNTQWKYHLKNKGNRDGQNKTSKSWRRTAS